MACKGTKITPKEIDRMVELYEELQSYKAVGKKMRRSPDTVSKYVGLRTAITQVGNYYENALFDEKK